MIVLKTLPKTTSRNLCLATGILTSNFVDPHYRSHGVVNLPTTSHKPATNVLSTLAFSVDRELIDSWPILLENIDVDLLFVFGDFLDIGSVELRRFCITELYQDPFTDFNICAAVNTNEQFDQAPWFLPSSLRANFLNVAAFTPQCHKYPLISSCRPSNVERNPCTQRSRRSTIIASTSSDATFGPPRWSECLPSNRLLMVTFFSPNSSAALRVFSCQFWTAVTA